MIAGTIISWAALYFAKMYISDIPLEMFYVIFWLFADALVRYLFIEKLDFRDERIRVGRLASMRVEFEEDTSKEIYPSDENDNSEFDSAE